MFIADHRNQVVTENDLAVVVKLRADYIDRFVRVRREKTALCQLLRQKSTDNFRALHADNRVDHGVIHEVDAATGSIVEFDKEWDD